jgi:hypothetical protein
MVGGEGCASGAVVAAKIATSWSLSSGENPAAPGIHLIVSVALGWLKSISVTVVQMILHASELSCLELVWHQGIMWWSAV